MTRASATVTVTANGQRKKEGSDVLYPVHSTTASQDGLRRAMNRFPVSMYRRSLIDDSWSELALEELFGTVWSNCSHSNLTPIDAIVQIYALWQIYVQTSVPHIEVMVITHF